MFKKTRREIKKFVMLLRIKRFIKLNRDEVYAFRNKKNFCLKGIQSIPPKIVEHRDFFVVSEDLSPINRHSISKMYDIQFDKLVKAEDLRKDLTIYGHKHNTPNFSKDLTPIFKKIDDIYKDR